MNLSNFILRIIREIKIRKKKTSESFFCTHNHFAYVWENLLEMEIH